MSTEENKNLIRRYADTVNKQKPELLDELFTEDFVSHCRWENLDGLKKVLTEYMAALPDVKITVDDMIAENDKVVIRNKVVGTAPDKIQKTTAIGTVF